METVQPTMTPPVAPQPKSFWPYLITIVITALIAVGATYWLTKPTNETAAQPTATSVVVPANEQTPSEQTPSAATDKAAATSEAAPAPTAPTSITAAQAEVAVQSIITDKTVHVRYNHMSTDNTKYIVQAYYDYGDHVGTQGWYRVDKGSGVASLIDTAAGETE